MYSQCFILLIGCIPVVKQLSSNNIDRLEKYAQSSDNLLQNLTKQFCIKIIRAFRTSRSVSKEITPL